MMSHKIIITILLFLIVTTLPAQESSVLLINSYHQSFPWVTNITNSIRETFADEEINSHFYIEHMDTKRLPYTEEYKEFLFQSFKLRYKSVNPSVIIVSDNNAFSFIKEYRQELFPDVPVVFCGLNNYTNSDRSGFFHCTGITEEMDADETVLQMLQMYPQTETIFVLNDALPSGVKIREVISKQLKPFENQVEIVHVDDMPIDQMNSTLKSLPENSLLLLGIYFRDSQERFFTSQELSRHISENCSLPIFSVFDFYIDYDVLGGVVSSSILQGKIAAEMAISILKGNEADSIDVVVGDASQLTFNYPAIVKKHISLRSLPEHASIIHRPFSFFNTYKVEIIAFSIIVALLILLILLLLIERKKVALSQKQLTDFNATLSEKIEALRESESFSKQAMDNSWQLFGWTDPQGTLLFSNETSLRLINCSLEEVVGLPFWDTPWFNYSEEKQEELKHGIESARNGKAVSYSNIHIDPRGDQREIEFHITPTYDCKKSVKLLVVEGIDVTDRKRAERKKEELMFQLSHSQKMDAIGQLSSGVAHDFNNMLAGILGSAEFLNMDARDDQKEMIQLIIDACQKASKLTSELLLFSRKSTTLSSEVDIHKIIGEVKLLLSRTIDKRITIETTLSAEAATIIGDDTQIQTSLMNLGINASHAMPEGGTLEFSTKVTTLDEIYCAHSPFDLTPGLFIEIEVRDSGFGMDEKTVKRIFEPFFTTKEVGKGTGLGLSAVYGIVEEHKGLISVYSEPGVGTVFHILLPLVESGSTVDTSTVSPDASTNVSASGTILLVDDEELIRLTTSLILQKMGYSVIAVENGKQALEVLEEKQIDLVILDMIMPVMNGRETFEEMNNRGYSIPVILSSGFSREQDVEVMQSQGLFGFIHKPYQIKELSDMVTQAINA